MRAKVLIFIKKISPINLSDPILKGETDEKKFIWSNFYQNMLHFPDEIIAKIVKKIDTPFLEIFLKTTD